MRLPFLAGLALVLVCPIAVHSQETTDHMLDVGGHRLHFRVATPREPDPDVPVIVLDAGFGLTARFWERVQPALVEDFGTTVVAYSRAGYGESDLPDSPYDIEEEVADLHSGLTQLGLAGDVFLVAHSYAGMLAHIFARRWESSVAGIVFLDPGTPALYMALPELFLEIPSDMPSETKTERAMAREWVAGIEPFVAAYRHPLPPDVPIVVVSSETGPPDWEPRQIEVFFRAHDLLAKAVRRSVRQTVGGTNHFSVAGEPAVVLQAVRALVALGSEARQAAPPDKRVLLTAHP